MENKIDIYLNTTPCQFSFSKTKRAIKYINHLEASRCLPGSKNGVHHTTIILTNNSLIDGRQWRLRLDSEIDSYHNIAILSSDKKRARFTDVKDFFGYYLDIKKPNDLIDTLVVCNNDIRNRDIKKIIETCNGGRINLKDDIGIKEWKFTVMFDEADKPANLSNVCDFISYSKELSCIDSIHLITATPYDNFWKKLKKQDLNRLKNLRHHIEEMVPPQELIEEYRQLKEHKIVYVKSTMISDEFIIDIYNRYISNNQETKKPMILFAPPSKYQTSHERVKDFFYKKNFIVVVINGKTKDIYVPNEKIISINTFNERHFSGKLDVEMYKTLAKLHSLYFETNIVITGFCCIERGITFQSDSFNFTDMIIPPIKDISTSVQLIGRANGGKKYVNKHNIYIQEEHYIKIKNQNDYALNLINQNPIEICETDFREKTNKEKDMNRWEIPISIDVSKEIFEYIVEKRGKQFVKERTFELFKENDIDIQGYHHAQWTNPIPDKTYNKNILPLLNAIKNKEKFCQLHQKEKDKNIKLYSVYFDNRNNKVILLRYNGDK